MVNKTHFGAMNAIGIWSESLRFHSYGSSECPDDEVNYFITEFGTILAWVVSKCRDRSRFPQWPHHSPQLAVDDLVTFVET